MIKKFKDLDKYDKFTRHVTGAVIAFKYVEEDRYGAYGSAIVCANPQGGCEMGREMEVNLNDTVYLIEDEYSDSVAASIKADYYAVA